MKTTLPDNEKAVWLLKTKGPQTLAALAAEMKVTTEGARFQLLRLSNDGLVEARTEAKGRGRPQQIWSLTALGHTRFPDTHAELTVKLIQKIQAVLGKEALTAVIEANGKDGQQKYTRELENITHLEGRIEGLAAIRDREGYMASYTKEADGGYLLVENHCPICAAATICMGFCQSELETFRTVLGNDVTVERTDHILAGARRCAYKITCPEN